MTVDYEFPTMTNYTPHEILFERKANIPGHLRQRSVPLYNYDLIHDIKKEVAGMSKKSLDPI
jgi:hypothetical protein